MPVHVIADPFVFVPISSAEAAQGRGAAKRVVRAHVTRVQHAKTSTPGSHMHLQPWTVKPYTPRESLPVRRKLQTKGAPERKRAAPTSSSSKDPSAPEDADKPEASGSPNHIQALVRAPSPRLPTTGGASEDPFWTFPVDYQPWLPPVFAHYIQNIAVNIPDIDGPGRKGLLRRVWFPLCMTEPATMYAVLLMAASHYAVINPTKENKRNAELLRARAVHEIIAAISEPGRVITDAMIGAVAKMAAYEAVFGDTERFQAHMEGVHMMLNLRGGMSTLGLDGLLERMLVWINLNACWLTGVKNEKFESLPTQVFFEAPDPYHFAGIA